MRLRWTLGAMAAISIGTAGLVSACSGDDSNGNTTSDGGVDATTDGGAQSDGAGNDTGSSEAGGGAVDLQILTVSDWHCQVDPIGDRDMNGVTQQYGGAGVLKTYLNQEIAKNPNTVFVTAGDVYGASPPICAQLADAPSVAIMNYLNLSVDTIGNHNFDNGIARINTLQAAQMYPSVSTNLTHVDELTATKPGYIIQTVAGVKIGFIGLTDQDAAQLILPGRMGDIAVTEPIGAANKAAQDARAAGAQIVVALYHQGAVGKDAQGNPTGPLLDFANGVQNIDLVIGDHTDFIVNQKVGNVLVVENRSKGRTYARVALHFDGKKLTSAKADVVDPIGLYTAFLGNNCVDGGAPQDGGTGACRCPSVACPDSTFTCNMTTGACQKQMVTPDPGAETILAPYRTQLAQKFDQTIGTLDQQMLQDKATLERVKETPLGDFVTDVLLATYKPLGAQIAFTNGGGLRDAFPGSYKPQNLQLRRPGGSPYLAGPPFDLVVGDVYAVLPFGNTAVIVNMNGHILHQILEQSVSKEPSSYGGFLQISGFKYTYSSSAPSGTRVTVVTLNQGADGGTDVPIPDDANFKLVAVTNNFTAAGGDGYALLGALPQPAPLNIMADDVLAWVKANPTVTAPTVGRITALP